MTKNEKIDDYATTAKERFADFIDVFYAVDEDKATFTDEENHFIQLATVECENAFRKAVDRLNACKVEK